MSNNITYDIRDYFNEKCCEEEYSLHTIDVLENIFNGKLLDSHVSGSYQGEVVSAWKLEEDFYAIVSSYFGSCAVCDVFVGSSKETAIKKAKSIVNSARKFENKKELIHFIKNECEKAEQYPMRKAKHLQID